MKTIYKYELNILDLQRLSLFQHANFLDFQCQNDKIVFWMEVDTNDFILEQDFYIVGTGNPIPEKANYHLSTVQVGEYVWHIYSNI